MDIKERLVQIAQCSYSIVNYNYAPLLRELAPDEDNLESSNTLLGLCYRQEVVRSGDSSEECDETQQIDKTVVVALLARLIYAAASSGYDSAKVNGEIRALLYQMLQAHDELSTQLAMLLLKQHLALDVVLELMKLTFKVEAGSLVYLINKINYLVYRALHQLQLELKVPEKVDSKILDNVVREFERIHNIENCQEVAGALIMLDAEELLHYLQIYDDYLIQEHKFELKQELIKAKIAFLKRYQNQLNANTINSISAISAEELINDLMRKPSKMVITQSIVHQLLKQPNNQTIAVLKDVFISILQYLYIR